MLKRKALEDAFGSKEKRIKVCLRPSPLSRYLLGRSKKQWRVPWKEERSAVRSNVIQSGDSGIWATCNKGKESKCVGELRDLFTEYAEMLYGDVFTEATGDGDGDACGAGDIEREIQTEVAQIHKPPTAQLFTPVRLDVQCVVFFKTISPVEPIQFAKKICEDAMAEPSRKRTRFAKRLSPMTLIGRASSEGLEKTAKEVLAPHFHREPFQARKLTRGFEQFAIRPTFRNHNILKRDNVIKQIATIIGPGHIVDLNGYELLVIVEIYQNICGISVLDNSFGKLKRLNLAEIYDPTPKDVICEVRERLASATEEAAPSSVRSLSSMDFT